MIGESWFVNWCNVVGRHPIWDEQDIGPEDMDILKPGLLWKVHAGRHGAAHDEMRIVTSTGPGFSHREDIELMLHMLVAIHGEKEARRAHLMLEILRRANATRPGF